MDRRRFLKMGLAATGSIAASAAMPLAASARGDAATAGELANLLKSQGLVPEGPCLSNDSCLIIDPSAFSHNITTLKKDLGPKVDICAVMKSDAYGNGVENLTKEAVTAKPRYIGLVENREIRKAIKCMDEAGQRATILRIAPATFYEAAESVVSGWPVEETVGSLAQARMLSRIAGWVGEKRGRPLVIPIHININTGMARMGFMHVEDIKKAMALPGLEVRGVMTHFANAYDPDLKRAEKLTRTQVDKFEAVAGQLDLADDVIRHTANSGATLLFPWSRFDMVRVGGALYGDVPVEMNRDNRYRRVPRAFKSSVVWIMDQVPPGTPVGYDSMYHTPEGRASTLATVKIGYNNGLPSWAFEKKTQVLIRGRRFPMVGKTSMNMAVVDVSGQDPKDPVRLGDEVVIFGRQGKECITLEELEKTTEIPECEIMLAIGNVNPRVLVDGE